MTRVLGIDWGTKRVGVALSDEEGVLAFPLDVYPSGKRLLPLLRRIIDERGVSEVVVGESKDSRGAPNAIMKDIDAFRSELEKCVNIPVAREPEFMTSVHADAIQGRIPKRDASAAALILQRYLDRKNLERKKGGE